MFEDTGIKHTVYALPTRWMIDAMADWIGVECPEELKYVCVIEGTLDYYAMIFKLQKLPRIE